MARHLLLSYRSDQPVGAIKPKDFLRLIEDLDALKAFDEPRAMRCLQIIYERFPGPDDWTDTTKEAYSLLGQSLNIPRT